MTRPHFIDEQTLRDWVEAGCLPEIARAIAATGPEHFESAAGLPPHIAFVLARLHDEGSLTDSSLSSIPFHSLCRGLFLPLANLPQPTQQLFGVSVPRLDRESREALVIDFLEKNVGLSPVEKVGCMLGDPFSGRASRLRQDSLLRLLRSASLFGHEESLIRLAEVGDVATLFAEQIPHQKLDPPLTAAEVLRTLRFLPDESVTTRFRILRSLLLRCGRLEAFFLARLLLSRTGFGFDFQRPFLARVLASQFEVPEASVSRVLALTDIFRLTEILSTEGEAGLQRIQLKPLSPIRPALASGSTQELTDEQFPVWVECKYDGVRMLLHRSTDSRGQVLCGAYTRNGNDWLESVPRLKSAIDFLPARDAIIDGELCGDLADFEVTRPASVYEVMATVRGDGPGVALRYLAFDLLYLNGTDLTARPLAERQQLLHGLMTSWSALPLAVPVAIAQGHIAESHQDINRLYHHFRSRGHEGVITKQLQSGYQIDGRDPNWLKRKPAVTLDLVILGATFAVTTKTGASFGSWVVAAREERELIDVGDVDGVDRARDMELCHEIMRNGLMTGRRIKRRLTEGTRTGIELRPQIVVTVVVQEITRHSDGSLSLRHPRIAAMRLDKTPEEADSMERIRQLYAQQRFG